MTAWPWQHVARSGRHSLATLRRSPLAEISGALGDLGTLLPLMAALALQGSVSLSSTLVFSGLFNIATGLWFGIPLPVQPMKAIAAAAIAQNASLRDTVAAGALVSGVVLVLAVTGLLRRLAEVVPVPVVKGIQVGAGLSLALSAGGPSLLGGLGWLEQPSVLDNRLWALAAFAGLLLTQRMAPVGSSSSSSSSVRPAFLPFALVVFLLGFVFALLDHSHHAGHVLPHFALWTPRLVLPHWLSSNAWAMAVAQLPLTTLNSVVAVSALAEELFSSSALPLLSLSSSSPFTPATSVTAFGCSVGVMNLVGCWFGAMPVCHGAGGLAAQYRFGARSGASVILLGAAKLLLGLFWGETLLDLLRAFPRSFLGVLVLAAGLELTAAGATLNEGGDTSYSAQQKRERWTVMLMTAACLLAFKNDAVGFVAGLLCHGAYRLADALEARRSHHNRLRRPGHHDESSTLLAS
ncbi:hypothetical protein HMPREF1624_00540 [Sporothrix schenckii ATCC 58251]|uniref:Sulfate transporter n=1 Tax=Sporothrix schenckii (strain ATCC 58251 / de Perez 2211183) TaxID=1391915 RepID=U7Q4W6_SPOS1|nr:hypothetical protein HMPREF1624_00540 [Sporothrix schenckii ATCC 58251]